MAAGDPQAVFVELGALLASIPNLRAVDDRGQIPDATLIWLAELDSMIEQLGGAGGLSIELNVASNLLISTSGQGVYASKVKLVAMKALALARSRAPIASRGAFIPTGADFDAFTAMSEVFQTARYSVLIVDPYMDATALTSFAVLAAEGVRVDLLTDRGGMRPDLAAAAKAWIGQYRDRRPIRIRAAAARSLHDRALIVDDGPAWILTQSLKDFAARSPATIQRVDTELAGLKQAAYADIWRAGDVVIET